MKLLFCCERNYEISEEKRFHMLMHRIKVFLVKLVLIVDKLLVVSHKFSTYARITFPLQKRHTRKQTNKN